jgi:hypothetical protein
LEDKMKQRVIDVSQQFRIPMDTSYRPEHTDLYPRLLHGKPFNDERTSYRPYIDRLYRKPDQEEVAGVFSEHRAAKNLVNTKEAFIGAALSGALAGYGMGHLMKSHAIPHAVRVYVSHKYPNMPFKGMVSRAALKFHPALRGREMLPVHMALAGGGVLGLASLAGNAFGNKSISIEQK